MMMETSLLLGKLLRNSRARSIPAVLLISSPEFLLAPTNALPPLPCFQFRKYSSDLATGKKTVPDE